MDEHGTAEGVAGGGDGDAAISISVSIAACVGGDADLGEDMVGHRAAGKEIGGGGEAVEEKGFAAEG